jgi:DNA-binding NtrC family response regulator
LLDDVDDLPLELQVKLLRVLQEGTLRRVGGGDDLHVDVRVVATSKVFLERAVEQGRFRADLLYRLRGLEIAVPPLRARGEDLLLLAQHFLQVIAAKAGQPPKSFTADALASLRRHAWPGNVRELWRAVETAAALCREADIGASHLPDFLTAGTSVSRPFALHLSTEASVQLSELVREFEDDVIAWGLRRANGQQARAAELLGVPRTTLQSKLGRKKPD